MHIWVDADACPNVIKDILYKAAERVRVELTLVSNQPLATPPSRHIHSVQVRHGFDVADNHIAERVAAGDLVITADIPLADAVITRGAFALDPRGSFYTADNIRQRLALRNFLEELRSTGVQTGGPPPLGLPERQAFANALDRFLTRHRRAGR